MAVNNSDKAIVLFDGVCNFCNASVNFAIKHDTKNRLVFAPLQSEKGKELLARYAIDTTVIDSFVLIENDRAYIKSAAALRLIKHLNRLYPLLYGFIIIPPFIRNSIYDFVSRNRYKWFGRKESCMVPNDEVRRKFIS